MLKTTKKYIAISFLLIFSYVNSQTLSEGDIELMAKQTHSQIAGKELGNGLTARGSFSEGRTLIYEYEVPSNWQPDPNMRSDIKSNFKENDLSSVYFKNDIDLRFLYFKNDLLVKRIDIKSEEFYEFEFELEEYVSIKGHPKAKDVDLKLQPPLGWKVLEGNRPNIVKKFEYETNSYLILVKDNITFFSRNEYKDLLNDNDWVNEIIANTLSFFENYQMMERKTISIDNYPALKFTVKGVVEKSGYEIEMIMSNYMLFYEDKIITLQAGGLPNDFKRFEGLFDSITNSIIFPEQYK